MSGRSLVVALCLALVPLGGAARGASRLVRNISDIPRMPSGVADVAQDTTGYLWLASVEGLDRYDGFEIRPWGREATRGGLRFVSTGPGDRVVAGDRFAGLFEVADGTLRRVDPPDDAFDPGAAHAVFDRDGTLWATWGGALLRRDENGWVEVGGGAVRENGASSLAPGEDGGVIAGTRSGAIWRVDAAGRVRRLTDEPDGWITHLHDDPAGPVAVVRFGSRPGVVRVTDGGVVQMVDWSARPDGLVRRGDTYWVAYTEGVWVLRADGTSEFLGEHEGFTAHGSIGIDREGGLWLASVRGLSHFPQPDTRLLTPLSGLPWTFLRAIHAVPDGLLLTTWRGPITLDAEAQRMTPVDLAGLFSRDIGCPDSWGGVWFKAFPAPPSMGELDQHRPETTSIVEFRDGRAQRRLTMPWFLGDIGCDLAPDGSLWILAGGELYRVAVPGTRPTLRGRLTRATVGPLSRGLIATADRLVAAFGSGEICEVERRDDHQVIDDDEWDCSRVDGAAVITDMVETTDGRLWLAAVGGGVFEEQPDGWRRVEGELGTLPSVIGLEPSPRGGLWVLGWRERWRVEPRAEAAPVVVERLGAAHGIPAWQNGYGMLERPDGEIWLPLFSGLVQLPAAVRDAPLMAPSVTLTALVADGRQVPTDAPLELRHGDHALEVRWASLSFRDPTRVRYRMRLNADRDWTVLDQPFVRLAGLGAGRHRLELGASLDGRRWTERPAVVDFVVRQAWYLRTWFVLLTVAVVLVALYVAYRLRTAHLLRLERQRTRIATDLHDEMGAGLGSVGLLVGLLGDTSLDAGERREIGQRAAGQIKQIGESLSDIVWSLRPGTATLDALMLFLRQRVADLFPAPGTMRATVSAPEPVPALPLGLPQRRNLQWIAVEALHNAARHAKGRTVEVRLEPDGDDWLLIVRDDGRGIADEGNGNGFGLESMEHRAREIGATLTLRSAPGEGTEVSIRFRPGGRT